MKEFGLRDGVSKDLDLEIKNRRVTEVRNFRSLGGKDVRSVDPL